MRKKYLGRLKIIINTISDSDFDEPDILMFILMQSAMSQTPGPMVHMTWLKKRLTNKRTLTGKNYFAIKNHEAIMSPKLP